jgi:hypothetical protein
LYNYLVSLFRAALVSQQRYLNVIPESSLSLQLPNLQGSVDAVEHRHAFVKYYKFVGLVVRATKSRSLGLVEEKLLYSFLAMVAFVYFPCILFLKQPFEGD